MPLLLFHYEKSEVRQQMSSFRVKNKDGTWDKIPVLGSYQAVLAANEAATNAQNAAKEVKEIYGDGNFTPLSDLLGGLGTKLKRWGAIFANKVFASNLPIVYNSVAEMKADTMLWEGMNTKTLGYYAPNDGGGASYLIRAKLESDTNDGGSLHQLQNGLVAELLIENDTANIKQFGAIANGETYDTDKLQNAINNVGCLDLLSLRIMIDDTIQVRNNTVIKNGKLFMPSCTTAKNVFNLKETDGGVVSQNVIDFTLENITFNSVRDQNAYTFTDTVKSSNLFFVFTGDFQSANIKLMNCHISQCEYCIKASDVLNLGSVKVYDSILDDSMMPLYSSCGRVNIVNSILRTVATNYLYHAYYVSPLTNERADLRTVNSSFYGSMSYVYQSYGYDKYTDTIINYVNNCYFETGFAIYGGVIGNISNSVMNKDCYGDFTVYNSHYVFGKAIKNKINIYNSEVIIPEACVFSNTTTDVTIFSSRIFSREDGGTYPVNLQNNAKLRIEKCVIISSESSHFARIADEASLTLINNYIERDKSNGYRFLYNTGSTPEIIIGNICNMTDNNFPTDKGNIMV